MDLTVNQAAAWSVELETTFTSSAEPGRGNENLEVSFSTIILHPSLDILIVESYYFGIFLSRKGKKNTLPSLPSFPNAKIDNPVESN